MCMRGAHVVPLSSNIIFVSNLNIVLTNYLWAHVTFNFMTEREFCSVISRILLRLLVDVPTVVVTCYVLSLFSKVAWNDCII